MINNYISPYRTIIFIFFISAVHFSCKKNWLDAKPNLSLVVPTKISDYQSLLDNTIDIGFNSNQNSLNEISVGEFYLTDESYSAKKNSIEKNCYIWNPNIYNNGGENYTEWTLPYRKIFTCNVILDGLKKLAPSKEAESAAFNNTFASALFFRSYCFFDLAQQFCKPYSKDVGESDYGIPLRTNSDFSVVSVRSTVEQTYDQILNDLKLALQLTPTEKPFSVLTRCRPNKASINGMLARVYLSMSLYDSANKYANNCLALYNTLIDYNSIDTTQYFPIQQFNEEVLITMGTNFWESFTPGEMTVDSNLYKLYSDNDLRKVCFFTDVFGPLFFQGGYEGSSGTSYMFSGIAVDEIYLIRAECLARLGQSELALKDLNLLIKNRFKTGTYVPYVSSNLKDIIGRILLERRKELCFRCLRWQDLRRLNKEADYSKILTRTVLSNKYTLQPNSKAYVFPIPLDVIQFTGMPQN